MLEQDRAFVQAVAEGQAELSVPTTARGSAPWPSRWQAICLPARDSRWR